MDMVTACTLDCPDACSLLVSVPDNGELRVRGNPAHPVTAGFACAKIRRLGRRLQSPNRITTPLLRQGKGWKPIDWEEALDLCAEKIQQLRGEPEAILHAHGEGDKGVLSQANHLFFAEVGASRLSGSVCDMAGIAACMEDFGSLETNDILDLGKARWIVNWGKDLGRSSTHVAALVRQARQKGAQVLTISPGGDGNRTFSDQMICIRPGTDRFLAAAVIRLMLQRDKVVESIQKYTTNWSAFRELAGSKTVEELAAVCGVDPSEVEDLFHFYARSEPVATLLGWGLQRYVYGGETVRFINALALLSGNIGHSGGGSYFNISSARNFNFSWARGPEEFEGRTLLLPRIGRDILEAQNPPIRMIWVNGFNLINQTPESGEIARAFAATPFKVVVDAFMTDTAERADLVLPCTLMLEKEDVVGSFAHNYVNYARAVLKPPGEARSDHWILSELGRRLNPPILLPERETCLRDSLDSPHLGISLEDLRRQGFVRANRPEIAYTNFQFDHADGKYRLPTELHPEPSPPSEFPLRLLTLVRGNFIHSQILPEEHVSPPSIWLAPDSPGLLGLDPDRDVFLVSPLGRLKVRLEYTKDLHPEVVIYRRADWMKLGGGANQLIAPNLTDMGDCAAYYSQYVRLEN